MVKQVIWAALLVAFLGTLCQAENNTYADCVVAQDGSGDYLTITEAIEALPMYQYERFVILVKNGTYNEKIRIEQDFITLRGESRDRTLLKYEQLRENWLKNPDPIGPAVINLHADDFVLENMTVVNSQPEVGPHAFTIYGEGTRTIIQNCNLLSKGGDTVSLWNYKQGMYYHANCHFEGAVDFVCPRGWCFIRDSSFYEVKATAAIWHAAVNNPKQRFVLKDCRFDGVEGYHLARHHYEAAFYLVNCEFSETMVDRSIYHVTYPDEPSRGRPVFWPKRYYYSNCHREGGDYAWHADHWDPDAPTPAKINSAWTFDGQWNPECNKGPELKGAQLRDGYIILTFDQLVTVRGELKLETGTGKMLTLRQGNGRARLEMQSESDTPISQEDLLKGFRVVEGRVLASKASARERFWEGS